MTNAQEKAALKRASDLLADVQAAHDAGDTDGRDALLAVVRSTISSISDSAFNKQ